MSETLQLTLHSVLNDQTELSSKTFLQNSIKNHWLLAVLTDTDDYEHLMSQQSVTESTDVKTVYNELLTEFWQVITELQESDFLIKRASKHTTLHSEILKEKYFTEADKWEDTVR